MKIIRMNEIKGKSITQYDSKMIMRKILMTDKSTHVGIMQLDKGGIVGYHDATVPQILLIIEGEGWVRSGTSRKVRVVAGDAVLWETGEGHETTSEMGLKAIVIESEGLEISSF
ncbi:cupin [Sporosarcina sp. Marseille-Q4063]|nr:cupin [Sporosarcina sp. Marseille-Q4063]QUW24101.1 cupin [Sporosarcina sp. Marseille-Q4063]